MGDTEKILRIVVHTEFYLVVALLVAVCWYVSSRTAGDVLLVDARRCPQVEEEEPPPAGGTGLHDDSAGSSLPPSSSGTKDDEKIHLTSLEIFLLIVCGATSTDVLESPGQLYQMGTRYCLISMVFSAILNALSFVLIGLLGRGKETTFQGQYLRIRGAFAGDAALAIMIIVSTTVDMITMVWYISPFMYSFVHCFSLGHAAAEDSKQIDMLRKPEYDQVLLRAGNPHDISVYDHQRYIWDEWYVDKAWFTLWVRWGIPMI